jgi:hypothetical protein
MTIQREHDNYFGERVTLQLNEPTISRVAELLTERSDWYWGSGYALMAGMSTALLSERDSDIYVRTHDREAFSRADYAVLLDRTLIAWHSEQDGWVFCYLESPSEDMQFIHQAVMATLEWQNQGEDDA